MFVLNEKHVHPIDIYVRSIIKHLVAGCLGNMKYFFLTNKYSSDVLSSFMKMMKLNDGIDLLSVMMSLIAKSDEYLAS